MKYLILTLSILFILLNSCSTNKDKETYLKLQGDWNAGFEQTFIFKDTLCNYLSPFGSFTSFRVTDDTIECKTKYPDKRKFKEIKFHILRLDEDSLQIEYKNFYTKKKEKIFFGRTRNKLGNQIQVDSVIYFMGFDSNLVATKYIKVVNDVVVHIKAHTGYSFRNKHIATDTLISKQKIEFINEKFSNIDYTLVEKYSSEYSNSFYDNTPQLRIYIHNKMNGYKKAFEIYNLYKYGCMTYEDNYPNELKIFMSYIDNIDFFIN